MTRQMFSRYVTACKTYFSIILENVTHEVIELIIVKRSNNFFSTSTKFMTLMESEDVKI